VVVEGEGGIGFFVIETGSATVERGGDTVGELKAGDHFGEIALVDERPRAATVRARTELRCWAMTTWTFRPLVESNPAVAWRLIEGLAARLRSAGTGAET
jgi:CRP/FNR family transcriptional regulator, cyclic AMP receptor protein